MIEELGWKTLEVRRKTDRLSNFYRALQGTDGWKEINKLIMKDNKSHNTRRKNERQVLVESSRRDVGKFSFINRTSRDWNNLDNKIFKGLEDRFNVKRLRKNLKENGEEVITRIGEEE